MHYNRWIYLGLGSNVGCRKRNLRQAEALLSKKLVVIRSSRVYESEPWGYKNQKKFCNLVLKVDCKLNPYELLRFAKYIERKLGRNKKFKWGPRTIDVDIIAYRNKILKSRELHLPHRFAHERLFVVKPLCELGARLTLNGEELCEILHRLEGEQNLETC